MNTNKKITIAVAGNPNSGKSTIFNKITGEKQHIGNYPGVTVDIKTGSITHNGCELTFVDLPGTYSLSANSPEELIARNFILEQNPSLVLIIADSTNLARQLYLTLQILELEVPTIIAFNKTDIAKKNNINIDYQELTDSLGVDAVATTGTKGEGIDDLLDLICAHDLQPVNTQQDYDDNVENAIQQILPVLSRLGELKNIKSSRWAAIKLLENDNRIVQQITQIQSSESTELLELVNTIKKDFSDKLKEESELLVTNQRYAQIENLLAESVSAQIVDKTTKSDRIDKILTNKFFGIPFFLIVMWSLFQLTFTVGEPLMGFIEQGQDALISFVNNNFVDGWLKSLVCDGAISGVGAVISFLPNILLLFLGIALLEFSGYMSRAAFVMDKLMQKIGLQGKSFIPMIIGFGCSVPAIMATRTLEDKKDRILTMMVIPFMSCGAKLPVYILLSGAFFPENAGTVIFIIYVIGVILGILSAFLLRKLLFKGEPSTLILELPSYHFPNPILVLKQVGYRGWLYVRKAGTIILAAAVILWFVLTFPGASAAELEPFENNISQAQSKIEQLEKIEDKANIKVEITNLEKEINSNENRMAEINMENTIGGQIGKVVGFILTPAGLEDWRLGTALLAGFAAKEIVVSTLGTVYSMSDEDAESELLQNAIKNDVDADGNTIFTPLIALSLMIFVLLYSPCLATVAVVRAETGKWKWTFFFIAYTTLVAFVASTLTYQIGSLIV